MIFQRLDQRGKKKNKGVKTGNKIDDLEGHIAINGVHFDL